MSTPHLGELHVALNALQPPARDIAERFIRAWAAAPDADSLPDPETFIQEAGDAQQATLRTALTQVVLALQSASGKTNGPAVESTLVLGDVTASSETANDPEVTTELAAPQTADSPDATVELPGSGSSGSVDATLDPSCEKSDQDLQFSWDPSGRDDLPIPRGEWPEVAGYQILGELGRGGMGVVYRARQRGLKRMVALKMILSGSHAGADQLERFRAEAEAVAHLQHPNIVQIYDVGERDGLPFFSLEFVDGHSLDQTIARQPQAPRRAAEIVEQLARAMDYAHSQGIVHRDLKPANILLTLDGIPKVTDFGLVKRLESDSSQTRTGTIMGTPSYMAPEQARGERDIGPPADTYALGSILYTMLTGRPPFMGPTPVDTVMLVINTEPVPPSRLQPKLPRDIEIICIKCLQKEPEKRYASALELAEDLGRFQRGEPILARPVGTAERLWRWCRRNPRVASLAAAVSVLAVLLMLGGPTAALLINEQRKEAVASRAAAETSANQARQAQNVAEIAQGAAEAAQKVADENAGIANTQRQLALDTLNQVVTQVEEKLRDRAELNDLRQGVLTLAMEGLENVSRTSETASLADRTIGAAHQRMGDILVRAGKIEEAREQFKKALAIFEKLMDAPEGDLVRWNAALTHDGLGDVLRKLMADEREALAHYEKALAYRLELEKIATSPKLKPFMIRASLANSYGRIAVLLLEVVGDPAQAAQYSEKAIAQGQGLLQELPDHPIAKQALAGAWNLHAEALLHADQLAEARGFAEQALAVREELRAKDATGVKARQDVAISLWTLSEIALAEGNASQALEFIQSAHAVRNELFETDPDNPEMQEDLGMSFYRLGIGQLACGLAAEAAESFRSSLEQRGKALAVDPNNSTKHLLYLQAQARCGEYAAALAKAEELRGKLYPSPGTLLKLASIYALCCQTSDAASAEHAATSLALLKQAVAAGYRDAHALAADADLAAVRSHPDFAGLLAAGE